MKVIVTIVDRYTGQTEIFEDRIHSSAEITIKEFWEKYRVPFYAAISNSDNGPEYYAQVGADTNKIVSIIQLNQD